jgi:hypothetical protein
VVGALANQGFILRDGSYEEQDQRGTYQILLTHIDGSEVAVHISPIEGEIGVNQIDLETSHPELRSENEMRQRAREVAMSLETYGLVIGSKNSQKQSSYYESDRFAGSSHQILEKRAAYGRN